MSCFLRCCSWCYISTINMKTQALLYCLFHHSKRCEQWTKRAEQWRRRSQLHYSERHPPIVLTYVKGDQEYRNAEPMIGIFPLLLFLPINSVNKVSFKNVIFEFTHISHSASLFLDGNSQDVIKNEFHIWHAKVESDKSYMQYMGCSHWATAEGTGTENLQS